MAIGTTDGRHHEYSSRVGRRELGCCLNRSNCRRCQMNSTAPHYLLLAQANNLPSRFPFGGRWRFVLEQLGSDVRMEESDVEPHVRGERLQLLAVIRGLESLEQPSRVTLITPSRYVGRGLRGGLRQWKTNGWKWGQFGKLTTIRHLNYWQRIDAVLQIHQLSCRVWDFDQGAQTDSTLFKNRTTPIEFQSEPGRAESRPSRNRIRVDEQVRRDFFGWETQPGDERPLAEASHGTHSATIKPVGGGRAYGYAAN